MSISTQTIQNIATKILSGSDTSLEIQFGGNQPVALRTSDGLTGTTITFLASDKRESDNGEYLPVCYEDGTLVSVVLGSPIKRHIVLTPAIYASCKYLKVKIDSVQSSDIELVFLGRAY